MSSSFSLPSSSIPHPSWSALATARFLAVPGFRSSSAGVSLRPHRAQPRRDSHPAVFYLFLCSAAADGCRLCASEGGTSSWEPTRSQGDNFSALRDTLTSGGTDGSAGWSCFNRQAPVSHLWRPVSMILGHTQGSAFSKSHPGDGSAGGWCRRSTPSSKASPSRVLVA